MRKRKIFILLCIAAISIAGISTGALRSPEKAKVTTPAAVNSPRQPHAYASRQLRQNRPDPPGTINGARNPELISDHAAYSILFRLVSNHQTEIERQRIQAYLEQAGLSGADIEAFITAANEFSQRVSVLDAQVKQIKDRTWPNPGAEVMAQLTLLQQRKEAIVTEIASSLSSRLTPSGLESLRQHINNRMKPHMKIHPGPATSPTGPGWKRHNMSGM